MPIYEYEPDDGKCDQCGGRFEALQRISDPPLTSCPECGKSCHRVLSAFATIADESKSLSQKNLEKHGFTRYEKTGDSTYEKTCGKGPKTLGGE